MFDIHIDDNQLNVYSLNISDLILRAAVEIESISKDLYLENGGTKTGQIKYDEDAIKLLNQIFLLDKKVVIISSTNCFLLQRTIFPFVKNEKRTGTERQTFGWNNSYQNLKHDRGNSLRFASVKYLFDIMAALFLLNIYLKNEAFVLGRDSQSTTFPINLGSEIFSISLHKWFRYDGKGVYGRKENFDECVYITKMTDESRDENNKANIESQQMQIKLFTSHPKFLKYISENDISKYTGKSLMYDVLGKDEYARIIHQSLKSKVQNETQYEGVINKSGSTTNLMESLP
jgi:hypothetical protein